MKPYVILGLGLVLLAMQLLLFVSHYWVRTP